MEIVKFNLHGPQEESESLMGSETSTRTIENLNLDQGLVDVKSNDESHHTLKSLATEKDTVSPGLAYISNIKPGGVKHHPDNKQVASERSHNGYEALDASYIHLPWDAPGKEIFPAYAINGGTSSAIHHISGVQCLSS
ncbi:hypothetical protein PNOK_0712600 [Pyrrhoderma noxium]|uniref:Uncharacterized protein n=1 Tax=Pyrrhoderma noxium TaxID=2282107 RepID=A0A286UBT8_9AGAM|nr:hypothetical protein PNOK_0712600 [Pyrrhoderma noxium]